MNTKTNKKISTVDVNGDTFERMEETANSIHGMLQVNNRTSMCVNFQGDSETDLCAFVTYMPKEYSGLLLERFEDFQTEFLAEVARLQMIKKLNRNPRINIRLSDENTDRNTDENLN